VKNIPEDYIELSTEVASNFDHTYDKEVAERLQEGGFYAGYPAWDWYGSVWFEDGQFHCRVKRYREHIGTVSADSMEELMKETSDKYGWS
jgi:hypothetical protein